ncbi:MAG: DUF6660 family protein [Salibacteraceae bacterium]
MKVLAIFFAFLTVTLTMYPCDDELLISSVSEVNNQTQESHGHGHQGDADHCSPFCVCAISSITRIENSVIKPLATLVFESPDFIYLAPFSSGVFSDIFQPPQA